MEKQKTPHHLCPRTKRTWKPLIAVAALFILICTPTAQAEGEIPTAKIRRIIRHKAADIGIALRYKGQDYTCSHAAVYPLMSVFKVHVAVAALHRMEEAHIALDDSVTVAPEYWHPDTYSPMRDQIPNTAIRHTTYRELLTYTVSHSDNNTCDFLIDFAGGIDRVDAYIRSLGIDAFQLTETEETMHENILNCYANRSSPLAVVQLLEKLYTEPMLTAKHFRFLEHLLLTCSTGQNKLKAGLPPHIPLAHKTGHSDRTDEGVMIGDADVGIIYLPHGERCYLAVLVKDSRESESTHARIMARVARVVYRSLK